MTVLFQRDYRITIGAAIGNIRAGLRVEKHRCAFRVEKTNKPEPNKCALQVWGLSREQRAQIEELRPKEGSARGVPVLIEAGYKETGIGQIYLGDLAAVYSKREGAEWITTIESGDGQAAKLSAMTQSYGPQTSPDVALRAIVKALGVGEGNVAAMAAKLRTTGAATLFPKRSVFSGSAYEHMTQFAQSAGLEWSIQDGAIQLVDRGRVLAGFATILSPKSGLIDTPTVDPKGVLSCKMLIQPGVKVGSLLVLNSDAVRGNYKIERATWEGDTHGTPWYITVEGKRY
jgi:hypothetical protein